MVHPIFSEKYTHKTFIFSRLARKSNVKINIMGEPLFVFPNSRVCFVVCAFLSVSSFGQNLKSVVFNPIDEDFANPERGWMSSEEVKNESFPQELWPHQPTSRLIWIRWTISDFIDGKDLSSKFFEEFQKMCDAARAKGFKIIPNS